MRIISIFLVIITSMLLSAYSVNPIDTVISRSPISKNSVVSVSVRDAQTEKIIYEKDANLLLHPASTLKALTSAVMLDSLGKNYKLSTAIYKDSKGRFYLKLCGDPMLTTEELDKLLKDFKSKGYKKIKGDLYVDDTALDNILWGTGWMWDDENNPLMPKFSAYNLDRNLVNLNGTKLPVKNPETYFKYQLAKVIKDNKIKFSGHYKIAKLPEDAVLIDEISHNLVDEITVMNHKSDNLAAESIFKLAGKIVYKRGTTEAGLETFNNYYSKLGLNPAEISIVDASGVSMNDLVTANWTTLALAKLYKTADFEIYKKTLATPTEIGTLKNRLVDLNGKLYAKTGTLSGISSICGYVTDKMGKTYVFSILIQNFIGDVKPVKDLEDGVIRSIF